MKFSLCGKRYQHLLKCQAPREWELRQFASEARTPRRRQAGRGRELREPCMPVGGSDRVRMSRGSPEMSFSGDSKSSVRKHMRVQVPPSAPHFSVGKPPCFFTRLSTISFSDWHIACTLAPTSRSNVLPDEFGAFRRDTSTSTVNYYNRRLQ